MPDVIAQNDPRLTRVSKTVLEQPLWMLFHKQDADTPHLKAAREWIIKLANEALVDPS
jgi:hypothetical protein